MKLENTIYTATPLRWVRACWIGFALLPLSVVQGMPSDYDREIRIVRLIAAPVEDVWHCWATNEGMRAFWTADTRIESRPGGAYEVYFNPSMPPGERGADGMFILAYEPYQRLAFTWNPIPRMHAIRSQRTHVDLRFRSLEEGGTEFTLVHRGWGEGMNWDEAFQYFTQAWTYVIDQRLIPYLRKE